MEVGQKVYLRPVEMGNAYRRDKSIKESIITKVGRKYFTVEYYGQFEISTGRQKTEYSASYFPYLSKELLEEYYERTELTKLIKDSIPKYSSWKIDIEKLRQIAEILDINPSA